MYKVKIAAIAKDESAYLSEWIFHHLKFGFDEIEIYINNTQDNSLVLLDKLVKNYPIKFKVVDSLFQKSKGDFQPRAYNKMVVDAKNEMFTHLFFLDIDEFWTPSDFETGIHQYLETHDEADSYLFRWAMHYDDDGLFSVCFKEQLRLRKAPQIKHLLNLNSDFKRVGIHNTYQNDFNYRSPSNELVIFDDNDKVRSKVDINCTSFGMEAFVVHRAYRSQLEYVSLLSRGRPSGDKIKNNRFGYYLANDFDFSFDIKPYKLASYYSEYSIFMEENNLLDISLTARGYIINRYLNSLATFDSELSQVDLFVLKKALINVKIPEIIELYDRLFYKSKSNLDKAVNELRDMAIKFELEGNVSIALDVMQIAQKIRPRGPVINKKIDQYKKSLEE